MAEITLRVLDGADRGRLFENIKTPITIGREEGNSIQLNDDRVSRFHVKIQEDNTRVVLTDLESTNGTKVNGEDITLRILRFGDIITLGRSMLLFGTRDQIAERLRDLRVKNGEAALERTGDVDIGSSLDFDLDSPDAAPFPATYGEPPDLPERMTPAQAAQLCEILEYIHHRLRHLLTTVKPTGGAARVTLDFEHWQDLLDLQARLAEYLRTIGEPPR